MTSLLAKGIRYAVSLIVVVALTFSLPRAMPGDPVMNIIGDDVWVSPAMLNAIRADIGLDRPVAEQFASYLWSLIHLDLGYSYHLNAPVADLIFARIGWTLLFTGIAIVAGAVIGILAGALAGWRPGTGKSRAATLAALAISCTPPYFLALLFLSIFSFRLGLFPFKGLYDEATLGSIVHHLFLPVLVLTLFAAARNTLIMRGSVVQEKESLYALYARAKGLSDRAVLFGHVLRNASLPIITQIALDFGFIFSGALFVEIVFSLNGLGTLIYDAVLGRDYPLLQGAFLIIAVMVICANLAADIVYLIVDPRIRRQGN